MTQLRRPPLQSNNHYYYYTGPLDVLRRTSKTEGLRGLYRGFGAVIVGGTPGTVLYLCTYDICKARLSSLLSSSNNNNNNNNDKNGESNFVVHFLAGMFAETVACIVYVPVDVIKERMQVQHSIAPGDAAAAATATSNNNYRNSWDAMKQISKTEGLSGVYRGYGATLASFGPFSALYFVFYEQFKLMTRQHLHVDDEDSADCQLSTREKEMMIPFQWTVLCSASAGALASWLTSPLDMAKLRLQVQRGAFYAKGESSSIAAATASASERGSTSSRSMIPYSGVVDCLRRSMREDGGGVKGLFRGAGARVLYFAPATTVTMTTYETCRNFIAKLLLNDE